MPRSFFSRLTRSAVICLIAFSFGCGGSDKGTTVKGSVTYDGKPVEKGYIIFHSKEGKGDRSVGGAISGGKFTVKNVPLGKCRVEVTATPASSGEVVSMDEAVKIAKQKKGETKGETKKDPDEIASHAEGNNKDHDIAAGTELNLTLKPPTGPAPAPAVRVDNPGQSKKQ